MKLDPSYRVLATADVDAPQSMLPKARHTVDGRDLPTPLSLAIVHIGDDPGFYLLDFDAEGNEQTDTRHDSMAAAMNQAQFEFGLEQSDWKLQDAAEPVD